MYVKPFFNLNFSAIKLTGPFVVMIYAMIMGDMFTFSIIYIIFLFGFTQSFFFVLKGNAEEGGLWTDYHLTWIGLFHMTLGEYDYEDLNENPYPDMAKIIFVLFQILIPILLFNMLIAMMGNTYATVNEKSEKEFLKMVKRFLLRQIFYNDFTNFFFVVGKNYHEY